MSYFGNSGPSQDGGFIAGIGAGAARLNNARATRARHAKSLGALEVALPDLYFESEQGYSRESDATLSEIAPVYYQSSDNYYNTRSDPNVPQTQKDQAKEQYLKDRNLIEEWARRGPFVHEGRAINLGGLAMGVAALTAIYLYTRKSKYGRKATGRKSAFYGVFS